MITKLNIQGFKSLKNTGDLPLGSVNVLIGANSAGKSNLVDALRMLSYVFDREGHLQRFVSWRGFANVLLFDSAQTTEAIELKIDFSEKDDELGYRCRLAFGASDTLFFDSEAYRQGTTPAGSWVALGQGKPESQLQAQNDPFARRLLSLLRSIKVYQFHNTSVVAKIRAHQSSADGVYLREDGGNLAAVLYSLQNTNPAHLKRIERTLRIAFPAFDHFVLENENNTVQIRWREIDGEVVFGGHQASDGTLRLMALLYLLQQPREKRPKTLVLDEPELGLHPVAIRMVADLVKAATREGTQIILATQSPTFLDAFEPEDILVVERQNRSTTIKRLSTVELEDWLNAYTLADLWDKNVLGGRPQ